MHLNIQIQCSISTTKDYPITLTPIDNPTDQELFHQEWPNCSNWVYVVIIIVIYMITQYYSHLFKTTHNWLNSESSNDINYWWAPALAKLAFCAFFCTILTDYTGFHMFFKYTQVSMRGCKHFCFVVTVLINYSDTEFNKEWMNEWKFSKRLGNRSIKKVENM